MTFYKKHTRLDWTCSLTGRICEFLRGAVLPLAVFAWIYACSGPLHASSAPPGEYEVKAAMVFNIIKFVEWPEGSSATGNVPFTICVFGKGEFGTALEALQGKAIRGRLVVVKQIVQPEEKEPCQILVIGKSERHRLQAVLRQLNHDGVLTISDTPRFASAGGIIGFIDMDGRVGFEINQETARRCRIKISSQLLKLARIVRDGE